jgi:xanthine/uracil/vitamin C permease (AzgA family)
VTAFAAAFFSNLMGLCTNYPIAMAPGMGINALFAALFVERSAANDAIRNIPEITGLSKSIQWSKI